MVTTSLPDFIEKLAHINKYLEFKQNHIKKLVIYDRDAYKIDLKTKIFQISRIFVHLQIHYYSSSFCQLPIKIQPSPEQLPPDSSSNQNS